MNKQIEALKLALEALELANVNHWWGSSSIDKAITAIKEALAQQCVCGEPNSAGTHRTDGPCLAPQPEQEPVVWMYQDKSTHEVRFQKHMRDFVDHGAWYEVPLYSEPLANQEKTSGSPIKEALAQSEQEPKCVAIVEVFGKGWRLDYMSLPVGKHKLYAQQYTYTTPPQRTWVGLTDEEIQYCVELKNPEAIAEEVEAKLKEKNI